MFGGLSRGRGTAGMQAVANGMQEALITTQTGLTIALPGLFIGLIVKNKRNEIAATLVRLESLILTTHFSKH
jgi:biopolymer transport protein ExbB